MVSSLAIRTLKVSDIDGADNADIDVVVRGYPGADALKLLNVTTEQAAALLELAVKDAITVEIRNPDGTTRAIQVPVATFTKWVGSADAVTNAAFLRGRKAGPLGGGAGGN